MSNIKKISNPLTIVAVFAALAEINGSVVLSLVPENLQGIFLWFVILFPSVLVVIFFITLNFNPKVLYAPSDFTDEDNFIKTIGVNAEKFEQVQLTNINEDVPESKSIVEIVRKEEGENYNKGEFLPETQAHVDLVNRVWMYLLQNVNLKTPEGSVRELGYGIQAPEYFLFQYRIPETYLRQNGTSYQDVFIVRVTEDDKGKLNLIAIGKDIIEKDPERFGERVISYMNDQVNRKTC